VDLGFFYDDLAPYGNWVERPSYGWAWRPRAVASTWRPYAAGHWAWTDEGWTWISDEPYGWATYHYGRWYDDPDYGWEWIPGNEWAPAWVSWQEGDDYVGWAPLPPSVDYRPGVDLQVSLAPDAYVFVPERQFLAPRVRDYFVPRTDYGRIFPATRNITRYNVVNNQIFNQGVPVDRLQRVIGRPVPRYQIADLGANERHQGARIAQNRVAIFRPQVERAQVAPPPSRPIAKRAVIAGAAAAAIVAAHHANRAAAGQVPPAATTRQQQRAERQQLAQQQGQQQQQRAQRQIAQQQQRAQRQAAAQQQGQQQQAQRQEAQQQRRAQRQPAAQQQGQQQRQQRAQRQEAQQQQRAQRQAAAQQQGQQQRAQRQQAQQQRGQQRQAQRQEAQPPRGQGNGHRNPGKPPQNDKKPPQQ
jgi:DNA segregation ATPase FtsK/SpoIIIE-like protein